MDNRLVDEDLDLHLVVKQSANHLQLSSHLADLVAVFLLAGRGIQAGSLRASWFSHFSHFETTSR